VLSAHVDASFGQQRYDDGVDFSTGIGSTGLTLRPLTNDAQIAFGALQYAVNRIRASLGLPTVAVTGVLDNDTYQAIFEVANSAQPITAALQPMLVDLKSNMAFRDYIMLAPFRTQPRATMLGDMAARARMWTALFDGIADTIWYSTALAQAPYAPSTTTSKLPIVIAGVIGVALGVAGTLLALSRS